MIAGKHYVSYEAHQETGLMLGVMRPGEAMQSASSSVPWNQSSSYILLDLNEVFNITILYVLLTWRVLPLTRLESM